MSRGPSKLLVSSGCKSFYSFCLSHICSIVFTFCTPSMPHEWARRISIWERCVSSHSRIEAQYGLKTHFLFLANRLKGTRNHNNECVKLFLLGALHGTRVSLCAVVIIAHENRRLCDLIDRLRLKTISRSKPCINYSFSGRPAWSRIRTTYFVLMCFSF